MYGVIIGAMARLTRFATWLAAAGRTAACLWALTVAFAPVPAQADPMPGKGMFLVASEDLLDPNFYRTVILLVSYGEEGAMGLVVNRPSSVLPRRILPSVAGLSHYNGPVFFGGPVMLDQLVFLWIAGEAEDDGEQIFGRVRMSASRQLLEVIAGDGTSPGSLRIYAGYAGWAPEQLEFEILQGGWRVVAASEEMVFAEDMGALWDRLRPLREPLTASLTP